MNFPGRWFSLLWEYSFHTGRNGPYANKNSSCIWVSVEMMFVIGTKNIAAKLLSGLTLTTHWNLPSPSKPSLCWQVSVFISLLSGVKNPSVNPVRSWALTWGRDDTDDTVLGPDGATLTSQLSYLGICHASLSRVWCRGFSLSGCGPWFLPAQNFDILAFGRCAPAGICCSHSQNRNEGQYDQVIHTGLGFGIRDEVGAEVENRRNCTHFQVIC